MKNRKMLSEVVVNTNLPNCKVCPGWNSYFMAAIVR
jgi:hypothetical protein